MRNFGAGLPEERVRVQVARAAPVAASQALSG